MPIHLDHFFSIDWESQESHLILNSRLPKEEAKKWASVLESFPLSAHIWLATSGSVQTKLVALSKKAMLSSAQAVNTHLQSKSCDIWVNALPLFHVGGIGIVARAYLNRAAVHTFSDKWNPRGFQKMIHDVKGTLTSLVPTQVYDLVIHQLRSPKSLRAVVVGGGALSESLYHQARELGWPLLPSYGMTECSSQIATAPLNSLCENRFPELEILSHINVHSDESQFLSFQSPALLTSYAEWEQDSVSFTYPVKEGWFLSQDRGAIEGKSLTLLGRLGDFIKIGGESVELGRLEKIVEEIKLQMKISYDLAILALPDQRLGHAIHLFSTSDQVKNLQNEYDVRVMPYERIRKVHIVPLIPRSALNKVLKTKLLKLIDFF